MAKQVRPLGGKVAVVTGGGRGIGRALARALTAEGCRVAVADVDAEAAEAVARELGGDTLGVALDVTDGAAFAAFLDEAARALGPIDVLVNNAGIMPVVPFADEDDATTQRTLEINLHAVITGTREGVRRMVPRRMGHIVNLASIAGRYGFPNLATYAASKHGVIGLSEAVRNELRGTGVEITVVMPAIVRTELTTGLVPSRGFEPSTPEEVARAIVGALQRPRFELYVPRALGPTWVWLNVVPRGPRELIIRLLRIDRALLDADRAARAAYEDRAAHSAPALEAVPDAPAPKRAAA
jgi:NAD(P)-dependent dehydrogenase (short-subunit alcohol dehydrogenase family)